MGGQFKLSNGRDQLRASESRREARPRSAGNQAFARSEVKLHPSSCGTTRPEQSVSAGSVQNWHKSRLERKLFGGNLNLGCERAMFVGCSSNFRPCDQFDPQGIPIFDFNRPFKCRSNPDLSKVSFGGCIHKFRKVKRTQRLLGLQSSNSNVCSRGDEITFLGKPEGQSSTVSAKTFGRSNSVSSLREIFEEIRRDDLLDDSNRRLLAQAAYEEWYFKKEKELCIKREEEKTKKTLERDNSRSDFERKRMKADEEYAKWLRRKRETRKEETSVKKLEFIKSKEEVERVFLKWKKGKDKELEKRRKEMREDEKKKVESERRKSEKKAIAEKAFQQWTSKLEEIRRAKKQERAKKKEQTGEVDGRSKGDHDRNRITFQTWKANKDTELKQKTNRIREATRRIEEERQAQAAERMYEAEQAFQDWLEKVDLRKKKQCSEVHSFQKTTPWVPV